LWWRKVVLLLQLRRTIGLVAVALVAAASFEERAE